MNRRERRQKRFLAKQKDYQEPEIKEKTEIIISKEKDTSNSIYYKHYKKLFIIPVIMLIAAIIIIAMNIATTGDFINKGISFTGGTQITISKEGIEHGPLEKQLKTDFPDNEIQVRNLEMEGKQTGVIIESDIIQEEQQKVEEFIIKIKEHTGATNNEISENIFGAAMGASFFNQLMVGVLIALAFMGIVVFLYFRTIIPSTAVILAAISDILVTIAVADLLGMTIGVAGITALLMLIGYSVDTDILLSSRVLKNKEGTVYTRVINSMKTGMTMTLTTMAAVIVTLVIATLNTIPELIEIMTIILIGLLADIINTWLQNAGILRWYMEKKGAKIKNE
ncbi:hypothetical protein K9L67_01450 [Candidatus Woesearchaeota archaeon]|nr:hypothetical protein [Candidatus Woesearchaeota archaeon]MCF7900869.1 hypothetical protein [Candidatus Woesearchaeota archaeon]MCF8013884.1 hypothetical protein [Candidatus Woesearchaeota archaeon]